MYPEAQKAFDKAKIALMSNSKTIFYTTILFSLKQQWQPSHPTAATNGKILLLNPDWFLSLSPEARIGLLMHEILHVALQHMLRLKERNIGLFNQAADYVINALLIEQNYTLPDDALYDPKYQNDNTEQVYAKLVLQEKKKGNNPNTGTYGVPGIGQDIQHTPEQDIGDMTHEISNTILRAATQAKMQAGGIGNIPGEILIELEKKINPKLPWNVILSNFMQQFAKDDYSYKRPNRRYMPEHYLPSLYSEAVSNICVAVDSSGSVTDKEFSYFIHEIAAIQQYMKPNKITLLDFDTEIKNIHIITEETNIFKDIKFSGKGGTNISPVLEWANKHRPTVLLIFTDGRFYVPEEKPMCPVIWLIHGGYPFTCNGQIIEYDIEA